MFKLLIYRLRLLVRLLVRVRLPVRVQVLPPNLLPPPLAIAFN